MATEAPRLLRPGYCHREPVAQALGAEKWARDADDEGGKKGHAFGKSHKHLDDDLLGAKERPGREALDRRERGKKPGLKALASMKKLSSPTRRRGKAANKVAATASDASAGAVVASHQADCTAPPETPPSLPAPKATTWATATACAVG